MNQKIIVLIVGTRPNYIKAKPLYDELIKHNQFKVNIVNTGQHYDNNMANIFFDQFNFNNLVNLNVNKMSNNNLIANIMIVLESYFISSRPDLCIIFGDVNSTLASALTCHKLKIKIAHIESGLRSFDKNMEEENNRIIVDNISDYLFVTEPSALNNLARENIHKNIYFVGNIMIDTLRKFEHDIKLMNCHKKYGLKKKQYILLTLHRPSNVDDVNRMNEIKKELKKISNVYKIIFPVHPRCTNKIYELFDNNNNIILIDPISYFDMINLVMNSYCVLTDSGGLQEETTALNIPCITLRNNTERPLTIDEGTNYLLTNLSELFNIFNNIGKWNKKEHKYIEKYWDGNTANRIVNILTNII